MSSRPSACRRVSSRMSRATSGSTSERGFVGNVGAMRASPRGGERVLPSRPVLFHLVHLLDAARVAAPLEGGLEERAHDGAAEAEADDALADAQHVRVVVQASHARLVL